MHSNILMKYQKYLSTTILKYANVLAKVYKWPYVRLLNMTLHDTYSITIHVRIITIAAISHTKRSKILLSKKQDIKAHEIIIQWSLLLLLGWPP